MQELALEGYYSRTTIRGTTLKGKKRLSGTFPHALAQGFALQVDIFKGEESCKREDFSCFFWSRSSQFYCSYKLFGMSFPI